MLRRYGEPVVYFEAWELDDLPSGEAIRCPACVDSVYEQARADCEVCYGTTLVSSVFDPTHWIDSNGYLTLTPTGLRAPAFGGYREPVLTRLIQPDVSTDVFRINDQGVLVRTQNALGIAYWSPTMGDNDMVIDVVLSQDQNTVVSLGERFLLKLVNPMTVRGWGRRAHDQAYNIGQNFQMNTLPLEDIHYTIPVPVSYGAV